MNLGKFIKTFWNFFIKNYFVSIFFACIAFVVIVAGYKLFFSKPTYVYARVKIGQGLWWASTTKPPIWLINSIKRGGIQNDLLGEPLAKILSVRYYPTYLSNQYDVYLTLMLKVSGNKKTGSYNFNRSAIGVGGPIDLEFPSSQFSGTIIGLSENLINDKYVEKTIYLNKANAYPWEADSIKVGDKYFDGDDIVFEIKDKSSFDTQGYTQDVNNNYNPNNLSQTKNVTVKAKIKVKNIGGQLVFGEEQIIEPGKTVYLSTDNYYFTNYVVSKVE